MFGFIRSLEDHASHKQTCTGLSFSPFPTEFQPSRNTSGSDSALGVENKPNLHNSREIFHRFQIYIEKEKPGLKRFYSPDGIDEGLKECAERGSVMTQKLMAEGCPREVAAELTLLALWDLVVLIGTNCLHMFTLMLCFCYPVLHSH